MSVEECCVWLYKIFIVPSPPCGIIWVGACCGVCCCEYIKEEYRTKLMNSKRCFKDCKRCFKDYSRYCERCFKDCGRCCDENYFNTYKNITANNAYKRQGTCGYGTKQAGFSRNRNLETLKLSVSNNDSSVHVYPNAAHNPTGTVLCITRDGLLKYNRLRKTEKDPSTGKYVDIFIFCSKTNTNQNTCNYNARYDFMYKITLDRFLNIKIYKYNKNG